MKEGIPARFALLDRQPLPRTAGNVHYVNLPAELLCRQAEHPSPDGRWTERLLQAIDDLGQAGHPAVLQIDPEFADDLPHSVDGVLALGQLPGDLDESTLDPRLVTDVTPSFEGSLTTAPTAVLRRPPRSRVDGEPTTAVCAAIDTAGHLARPPVTALDRPCPGALLSHPTDYIVTVTD